MSILYSFVSMALTAVAVDRFQANDFAKGFVFSGLACALAAIAIAVAGLPPQLTRRKRR